MNQKVAILGFGLEGKDLLKFLQRKDVEITILDQKRKKDLELADVSLNKVRVIAGPDYLKEGLRNYDIVYRSPGVYRYLPEIVEAEKRGVVVSSALKLFFDLCPAKIIGVTGTKGKGTTSTLIYEILKKAGMDAYLAGNIGVPYLSLLPKLNKNSLVVLELSSFQLIDLTKSPHIAVVLNITSDHMDWHKSQKEYVEAKKNIVKYQNSADFVVINADYSVPSSFAKKTRAKVIFFSKNSLDKRYKEGILLRGEHNLENIAAAVTVAKALNINDETILEVLRSFKGLEHRLELVAEIDGRTFYNDSFATGPQPTLAAVKSFNEPLTLILGGYDKGLDYEDFFKEVSKAKNLKSIIIIGDLQEKFEILLKKNNFRGEIFTLGCSKMKDIVKKAYEVTLRGGIVLLSPAAASFDMFANYKERGKKFKEAIASLN